MERRTFPNPVAEEHENNQEQKREYREEGHHSKNPIDANCSDPRIDIEVDGQAEQQPHQIQYEGSLNCVCAKALADVVDSHRNAHKGANGNEELPNHQYHPMELVLQAGADEPEAQWDEHEVCGPKDVQSILRLPKTIVASSKPQWDAIAKGMTVGETEYEAKPVDEGNCSISDQRMVRQDYDGNLRLTGCILRYRKPVQTAGLDWLLEPDRSQSIQGNIKAEANGVEASNDEGNWY